MEVPLPLQNPLCCKAVPNGRTHLKIEPFLGFLPHGTTSLSSQSSLWSKDLAVAHISHQITASADFSRRRQRRKSTPRTQDSAPKGFAPRTRARTSTQRRDQKNKGEKEDPSNLQPKDFGVASKRTIEVKQTSEEEVVHIHQVTEEESENEINTVAEEDWQSLKPSRAAEVSQLMENGTVRPVHNSLTEINDEKEVAKKNDVENRVNKTSFEDQIFNALRNNEPKRTQSIEMDDSRGTAVAVDAAYLEDINKYYENVSNESIETNELKQLDRSENSNVNRMESIETVKNMSEDRFLKPEPDQKGESDDLSLKLKLEMEAHIHKQALDRLAEENFVKRNRLFFYPEVVKPDQNIEVHLNRSLSTLKNEPDVLIMGAFNDWQWKSFTMKLNKTPLSGDWWACHVYVPKEAYKMDFVFYNGKDVYDNNDKKDFCIIVDGGMTVPEFEDILLEEKHKELEKLAKEEAEWKRQEEVQKQIEAENAAREADRVQAREESAKRREMLKEWMKKVVKSVDDVCHIDPSDFKGGDKVRLFYNKSSGPLIHAKELWLHGGHNNWMDGLSMVTKLARSERKDGNWWYAEVVVPNRAIVLDWVFADGPPEKATVFDNNGRQDFHAIVPQRTPEDHYWIEEEYQIYWKLREERRLREEAIRVKAEKTARMKAETKERTLKTFLLSQKHIVYTEPLDVQAGSIATVFYNPANTVLNGKPEIWFRCSFNLWTHRMGPLPPQRMLPTENGPYVKVAVKVPLDAYMVDFVFSEREDGGIFDNKDGVDYHIPVLGGVNKEPPMHIVHIAVEMAPIAKVGGLGDVVTGLSRAVQDLNHNVDVVLPKYDCLNLSHVKGFQFHKSYSWGGTEIRVWFGKVEGLSVYFLEPQNGFFWTGCIYGCRNDGERFGFFCHAALEFLLQSGFHPDIIHCHDWSSAPVAWLFKEQYMHYGLGKAHIVFTIHNLEFGAQLIGKAMAYSDKATTVSPTYSKEVSGNPAVAPHLYKFHGILNGIDPDIWDPCNDKFIPISYTSENVVEGKRAAKEALQQRLGLKRADLPLVGIITRLTLQKGIHLIKHAIWRTLDRGGQVVLLGSAPDPRIQNDFVNLANQLHSSHNDCARLCLTYDEPLSHLIYAGADFILVPSIFEPCGLTQLTAMRYGSIPVVRKTGGLYDTVFDVDHDQQRAQACGLEPNGFSFDGADAAGVDYALKRALSAWHDGRDWFNSLCKRVMDQDWSWNRPALDYMELYYAARKCDKK